jgi:hypothetical protein
MMTERQAIRRQASLSQWFTNNKADRMTFWNREGTRRQAITAAAVEHADGVKALACLPE